MRKRFVTIVFLALLLILSAMLIGPVVWRWGRREVVRLQSRSRWDSWCVNPSRCLSDGDPCCWLKIPSCGIDGIVLSGGSRKNLSKSICMERMGQGAVVVDGRRADGEGSLRVISGHRDTHFRDLRHVATGDELELLEPNGSVLQYRVADSDIIKREKLDDYIMSQKHDGWIVLLTCYPFRYIGSAPERYVVWCAPVVSKWER